MDTDISANDSSIEIPFVYAHADSNIAAIDRSFWSTIFSTYMDAIVTAISRAYIYPIEPADRDTYICSDYSTNMGTDVAAIDRSF